MASGISKPVEVVNRLFAWLGRHELGVLIGIAAMAAGSLGFVLLASEVMEGETKSFDEKILLAMRKPGNPQEPIGSQAVREAARDVTALGGITVLTFITLAVGGFLILDRKGKLAVFVFVSITSGMLASTLLKDLVDRPRPDAVYRSVYASNSSFPSGHSMMSGLTYWTLGALLARSRKSKRMKAYFLVVATMITIPVGVTRVYLGVHWPTDVLAGWTAGAVWALLCWLCVRLLQRRHAIEPPSEEQPRESLVDETGG